MSPPRRIALFGGTFDPIHLGHLEIARRAVERLALDEVRFLPCQISPHKTGQPPTPAAKRLAMIQLAIQDLPWAVADDFELLRDQPSFSHLTAAEMHHRFPEARIFWLMGRDQWEALPRWQQPERLASLVEFIVASRDGPPRTRPGWTFHHVDVVHPASASRIRESARCGGLRTDWLPPPVAGFIRENDLYHP